MRKIALDLRRPFKDLWNWFLFGLTTNIEVGWDTTKFMFGKTRTIIRSKNQKVKRHNTTTELDSPVQIINNVPKENKLTTVKWSQKSVDYLAKNYGKKPNAKIAEHLHRSVGAVTRKAQRMGLTDWTL